jgi:hypothetical protein
MRKSLIIVSLMFISCKGWATNGYIQSASCNGNSGTVACAFTNNVIAGNTILVGCLGGTGLNVSTDTKGQTYTQVGTKITPVARDENVFYLLNVAGGALTVTCSNTNKAAEQAAISEYGSTVTAGGFDVTSTSVPVVSTLVSATSGLATTNAANELMFEFCNLSGTGSSPNGTLRENFANNYFQATQDAIVASPSAYASTMTQGAAGIFGCIEAAFKPTVASVSCPSIIGSGMVCGQGF